MRGRSQQVGARLMLVPMLARSNSRKSLLLPSARNILSLCWKYRRPPEHVTTPFFQNVSPSLLSSLLSPSLLHQDQQLSDLLALNWHAHAVWHDFLHMCMYCQGNSTLRWSSLTKLTIFASLSTPHRYVYKLRTEF